MILGWWFVRCMVSNNFSYCSQSRSCCKPWRNPMHPCLETSLQTFYIAIIECYSYIHTYITLFWKLWSWSACSAGNFWALFVPALTPALYCCICRLSQPQLALKPSIFKLLAISKMLSFSIADSLQVWPCLFHPPETRTPSDKARPKGFCHN